jgi:hypothetical protein
MHSTELRVLALELAIGSGAKAGSIVPLAAELLAFLEGGNADPVSQIRALLDKIKTSD